MKIVLLGTAYPFRGGLAAYNERLIREFQNQGHQARIETFKLQYPNILFPGKTQYADWEAPKDLDINVSVNSINPFNWFKVGQALKKEKPDILIIKYWLPFMAPCFGSIAKIVRSNKHTKVISILDNILPHEKRVADRLFSTYFVNNVNAFVGMSDSVLNDLNLFDKQKPRCFSPHPIFDNFGTALPKQKALDVLNLDPNYKYILFFGLVREYKGLDILLKAMAQEKIKRQNIKLIVAGEFYSSPKPYKDIVEQEGLQDKVIFFEKFIPDPEVRYYFSASDLVVQPYKTATQSGVTQVAYQFEKPMVVTNVGGLPEIVPHNKVGYVVETNPEAVADAINDFYEHHKAEAFRPYILEEKEKYSWERMTQNIIDLYHKI